MYQIRKAVVTDLPRILEVYAFAREFMAKTGNPDQWNTTYPPREMLEEDIRMKNLYVVVDQRIHGVFAYFTEPDPTYAYIEEGAWLDDSSYCTIHRVASDGSGGVFSAVIAFTTAQNSHLRIDTHHDNRVMQHVLEKHGFRRCGIIYLEDGEARIAYEKV